MKAKTPGPDGSLDDAEVVLWPFQARDGYQTNEDILNALKITLNLSANFNKEKIDSVSMCVRMWDGKFQDGSLQCLYQADGKFKGAKALIIERRTKDHNLPDLDARNPITNKKPHLKCASFSCRYNDTWDCCLKKMLYLEPDFQAQKSQLKEHCEAHGYKVIFFPKYHPELNFIEQCWGFAKHVYWMLPKSTKEADVIQNVAHALESVPLESMRQFATRSSCFTDVYFHGLNGAEAAWANKKYCRHRTLPAEYWRDVENEFRATQ
ncbi:unnamed protein product [Mycena citricolor]|uniref:Tc1-like transposase DDE domain-containing protein n=1 Tax=Mycena citricolor TaxID=2018698 RepID=A0AAD2HM42_9AGAR|nr:unnamed protein product [Mycena citricolor]